ncbi:MAG TPA: DNA methyltransferase, partial [Thermodesulfobacteriota bacterium]
MTEKDKLKSLLKELFQFDCADLDFGIYRIMNFKRDAIEKFIEKDLIEAVEKELSSGILGLQTQAAVELDKLVAEVKAKLGEDAIDGDGILDAGYRKTPLGKRYIETQERAKGAKPGSAVEASIYNNLISFFSRYYDSGDFISKRRYSRREKYAIPYNGEEVYLHWANSDQYYVKTTEYFTDYRYKAPNGYIVHFKLKDADVEKDNVKGDKRFFLPLVKEATLDESTKTILIPFEYRPLTGQEDVKFPARNIQEAIIEETVPPLIEGLQANIEAATALGAPHHKTDKGKPVSYLEHHTRQYTRRNRSDYFIHKDLKGFLTRELDFYIKNEVLLLDELEAGGELLAEGWFQIARVIRAIGSKVIEFLAQIEDFQKMLFEKKKFVLDTQYCITVSNINPEFYPEIASNENQWQEWKELFHIDEDEKTLFNSSAKGKPEKRLAFLKSHPTLVLDTKHFSLDFRDKLIASFENLDDVTDGLIVKSENFQALNLFKDKYYNSIQCIHIDPPYNTATSVFLYKNDYQHSSWMSMMSDRIFASLNLLVSDGTFSCHIDENEYERLQLVLERSNTLNLGTMIWDKMAPVTGSYGLATQHEYVIWRSKELVQVKSIKQNIEAMQEKAKQIIAKHGSVNEKALTEWRAWLKKNKNLSKAEQIYDHLEDDGTIYRSADMTATDKRQNEKFYIPLLHPVTKQPCPVPAFGWRYAPETLQTFMSKGLIIFGADHKKIPRRKVMLTDNLSSQMPSVYSSGFRGKYELDCLDAEFPFAHSTELYTYILRGTDKQEGFFLDYFAGSGTTGHAVIGLNREDGGHRKFMLVEMGEQCDTVLLPRIKKVTFSPEWKDGKPRRQATNEEALRSPRVIKYFRMESYEDTLNNIRLSDASRKHLQFADYFLSYMLEFESKENEALLSVE